MPLAESDRRLVEAELGRDPTRAEAALFENLWSEHCAYRSSRPLLSAFTTDSDDVVVGPGDDAAVVSVPGTDQLVTFGVESHNHPSYVDPYDGAATGVGGIVRDTLSMGAYPIALADALYFGGFDRDHSRYLLDGVVEGISDYGNAIGVPTVTGSTQFHDGYEGNPLVNVACVGLVTEDRLVTAAAKEPGNKLVLVGNATGRDGLGGASFASEDLAEDAETEDRPAVQVGDPYTEKLLVEANEALVDEGLLQAARDLGAAGLGGASSELVALGGLGARIDLNEVHQREPNMNALEILLAESQERMCYEVRPEDVERVREIAERFDLGCSVIGEVTDGNYVCEFDSEAQGASEDASGDSREPETVVDAPAEFLADGAPMNDLEREEPTEPETDLPDAALGEAFDAVLSSPNTASKRWVYRQYDHEVGNRTLRRPGEDAAALTLPEADGETALAFSAGANPNWTTASPYRGAYATAVENATNLAAVGAEPLAAVDCLNGGNPEKPDVYGGFAAAVDGLADGCRAVDAPVVGGNVSLYNDSVAGPVPPTPTLAMIGVRQGYDAPGMAAAGDGSLVLVGGHDETLGGSEYLAQFDGSAPFPEVGAAGVAGVRTAANHDATLAVHDVSDGGLAVTLAEMVDEDAGVAVDVPSIDALFSEAPGRAVVETTDADALREAIDAPVVDIGEATGDGALALAVAGQSVDYDFAEIVDARSVLERELD
ncbi:MULTISPECIES: phosphoribosylformylglycinamidine synthase subunit PurL [Halobacterium]|uniref:phosphoribosylformylglycinamidine synthase subunit PurL n=1 Tax=Halobacterium TaxID=2239 RepID=UPI00073E67E0|nr:MULTISPECIES: phosphoribosylformylglycinamidine synthase subunit PurL [Halobacterium]MCG1002811.1 phosphoribosylformylglycinamidine synthase subunit PurL [Halobacterium noricense]